MKDEGEEAAKLAEEEKKRKRKKGSVGVNDASMKLKDEDGQYPFKNKFL